MSEPSEVTSVTFVESDQITAAVCKQIMAHMLEATKKDSSAKNIVCTLSGSLASAAMSILVNTRSQMRKGHFTKDQLQNAVAVSTRVAMLHALDTMEKLLPLEGEVPPPEDGTADAQGK